MGFMVCDTILVLGFCLIVSQVLYKSQAKSHYLIYATVSHSAQQVDLLLYQHKQCAHWMYTTGGQRLVESTPVSSS